MVGLFLADRTDELDLEHGWPGWGETAAMFGLAVRTHLAAGAAFTHLPAKVVWRGEIVQALGMIGLLLGMFFAAAAITQLAVAYGNPGWAPEISWWRLLEVGPVVAFAPVLLAVASLGEYRYVLLWSAYQLPSLVTFVCLCLGFHREAPTPPARRLLWWGGAAVLLGVLGGFASGLGLIVVGLVTVVVRVVAFVRGDFVLGRALSLFAVLQLAPLAFLLVGGEALVLALPIVVLLVLSALAPVRKPRLS